MIFVCENQHISGEEFLVFSDGLNQGKTGKVAEDYYEGEREWMYKGDCDVIRRGEK